MRQVPLQSTASLRDSGWREIVQLPFDSRKLVNEFRVSGSIFSRDIRHRIGYNSCRIANMMRSLTPS
jgi:hypothetical protein